MKPSVHGIHHITAIASDAQECFHFYTKVLGLRLVKKTVNQDDVGTYHLFFGNKTGEPGMDLTFFIFKPSQQGIQGVGQVSTISLAVPLESLSFWEERFDEYKVKHEDISTRFGKERLVFYDSDEQCLELVGIPKTELHNFSNDIWTSDDIGKELAVRSFYSATLSVSSLALIEPILTHAFGYTVFVKEQGHTLYTLDGKSGAVLLEIKEAPDQEGGLNAAGTVHHIAFEVADEKEQDSVRDKVVELGLFPTATIDRFYFKSVYFRTPAGILFELATSGPGFTADENESDLGGKLALPPFLESKRSEIEKGLVKF